MRSSLALSLLLFVCGCGAGPEFELPAPSTTRLPSAADGPYYEKVNELGFDLLQGVDASQDVSFSPVAVGHNLAVLMNGSSNKARDELLNALGLTESNKDAFGESQRALLNQFTQKSAGRFKSGTAVFAVWPVIFDQGFTKRMGATYGASVKKLGGATIEGKRLLDEWASERTGGDVESLGIELSKDQQLLAASVARFADTYEYRMPQSGPGPPFPIRHSSDDLVNAYSLSLRNEVFSLILLVPKQGVTLEVLMHDLHAQRWRSVMAGMRVSYMSITAPPIEIDTQLDVSSAVSEAGMPSLFNEDCNLRPMSIELERRHSVSAMPHRSVVAIVLGTRSPPMGDPMQGTVTEQVNIEGPFFFAVIENKTGVICVMGVKHPD